MCKVTEYTEYTYIQCRHSVCVIRTTTQRVCYYNNNAETVFACMCEIPMCFKYIDILLCLSCTYYMCML